MLLQVATCNLEYSVSVHKELKKAPDLPLLHLEYLDEDVHPAFAAQVDFKPTDYSQTEAITDLL